MVCKVILLCPISTFLLLIEDGYLFFKFIVYIVKFDKKQNPLKSIAENGSSLLQCIWIVCTTLSWSVDWGAKVSKHPVFYMILFTLDLWDFFSRATKRVPRDITHTPIMNCQRVVG